MSDEHNACATPIDDLERQCLEHYERLSSAANEWNNQVPQAIKAWYAKKRDEHKDAAVPSPRQAVLEAARIAENALGAIEAANRIRAYAATLPDESERDKVLEEAARAVEPNTPRPCDCVHCDCGNSGNARNVAWWDEGAQSAAAIRALKSK